MVKEYLPKMEYKFQLVIMQFIMIIRFWKWVISSVAPPVCLIWWRIQGMAQQELYRMD